MTEPTVPHGGVAQIKVQLIILLVLFQVLFMEVVLFPLNHKIF